MSKPEHRPEGCKYWLASDMIDWLKANTKLEDPEYAAKWWLGCSWAESIADMNARERTELAVDGQAPMTLDDITEFIQSEYEDGGRLSTGWSISEIDAAFENEWREFWEVGEQA